MKTLSSIAAVLCLGFGCYHSLSGRYDQATWFGVVALYNLIQSRENYR